MLFLFFVLMHVQSSGSSFRQHLDLFLERIKVAKFPVHGDKADIRHFIQCLELLDDQLTDGYAPDLSRFPPPEVALDALDDAVNLFLGDRQLFTGLEDACLELFQGKRLFPAVALDHDKVDGLYTLIGREPLVAAEAFPPTPCDLFYLSFALIEHLVLGEAAIGTFHLVHNPLWVNRLRDPISWG